MQGQKELLGKWLAATEGAKFWLNVLTELQNRGAKDVLIACVDGLKGSQTRSTWLSRRPGSQRCIVHMVRNSLKYVAWNDYTAVTADLKRIYQSATAEQALLALDAFAARWNEKYPQISKSWRANWDDLNTLFDYPEDIRKATYTTKATESWNSVIRKAIKKRKLFPTDDSVRKVVFLAIQST
jgi:transposase-like protein